jgi:hypothetical protein
MKDFKYKSFVKLVIFSLFLALIIVVLELTPFSHILHDYIWGMLIFYFLLSAITSFLTEYGIKKQPGNFQIFYFGGMGIRVFASMMVAFVVIIAGNEQIVTFLLNFFALYLFFLIFEIYTLLTNLRANSKKST